MNIYNVNDENFVSSNVYQDFLEKNPALGNLKIRAYAASQAIPIKGLQVVVSYDLDDNNKIIFFEGVTDESGAIEKISLPAPKLDLNNLDVPNTTTYDIIFTYNPDNVKGIYKVNMYEDICVIQNINIVPEIRFGIGGI